MYQSGTWRHRSALHPVRWSCDATSANCESRKARLNWIAFTERLENFSPSKWAQLRSICRRATTPRFAALPGLEYADYSGTRYVVFGDFAWPPDKVFSQDKKRIIKPTWWFDIGNVPLGPIDISHAPLHYWDLSQYDMFPIRTTINGQQVDENLDGYRYVHGLMDDPFPMAVDMFRDEVGLEAASKRMMTYIMQDMPRDVQKFYVGHAYYSSFYGFVSDGPIVTDWHATNEARITGGKWWQPGTERYRVHLSVHSTAPITDIRIYDGPFLFRRFQTVAKMLPSHSTAFTICSTISQLRSPTPAQSER